MSIRTRFAPSPTGDLHVGSAWTALASWAMARRGGGTFVVRVEDLDPPRTVQGAAPRILDDLRWLGLTWDEGPDISGPYAPYTQSERFPLYAAAVDALERRGLTYLCDRSRAEIARAASAPHAGEESEGTVYPGSCRDRDPKRTMKRAPAVRVRIPDDDRVAFVDGIAGPFEQSLRADVGDFVLRRGDGVYAYQLAVIVDDLAMGITDVVRGADLLPSTPRQIMLARLLGHTEVPRFWHLPMVVARGGARLAKRSPGGVSGSVRALRDAGVPARAIVDTLGLGLGLGHDLGLGLPERSEEPVRWPREPWELPSEWERLA